MGHKLENKIEPVNTAKPVSQNHLDVVCKNNSCSICGAKLLLSHISDYRNLFIQETSRCLDCGQGAKKEFHNIN